MLTESRSLVADAQSPAGSLAGLAEKARAILGSTATLRSLIILSFILYEVPYLRRLSSGDPWLPLPLWDLNVADDATTFAVLEGVYLCASVLACFRRLVVPACFVAGIASILLVVLDLSYRLQFAFLPGGALLAFGLSEILARKKDPQRRVDMPFVLLLGSIYLFASFHKLLNYPWMKVLVPSSVLHAPGGPAPAFCESTDALFLSLIVWTVVPYEALLGILTLARRWLKLRLACVSLFHWLLVALVPYIWHVSFFMLCLHLYTAALQKPSVRPRMLAGRNGYVLFGAEALFLAAKMLGPAVPGPPGTILRAVAFANLALFPLFFLFWPFWRAEREAVAPLSLRPRRLAGVGVSAFGALLLVFGFSPFLLEKHYSVLSLGWAMFAGGEYRDGQYFTLKTPASRCYAYPMINGMIWAQPSGRQIQYLAFRKADLERLKRYFERRKCGGPPLQVETGRF